jgi:diguanylate cyclase (GGDEF)-like protein/PAS domain S-box-containing protein
MIPLEKLLELEARGAASAPAAMACFDFKTLVCTFVDEGYAKLAGVEPSALIGRHMDEIVGRGTIERTQHYLEVVKRTHRSVRYAQAARAADGSGRYYDVSLVPITAIDCVEPEQLYAIVTDSTAEHEFAKELRNTADRSRRFFEASQEGMVFHQSGVITDVNPQMLAMLGYSLSEMIGHNTLEFVPSEEQERVRAVIASGRETTYESTALAKDGTRVDVEYTVRNLVWNNTNQRLILVRDITERRVAEKRIRFLALNDALTGLPNRAQLDARLVALIAESRTRQHKFATLFIDLDHLKRVNDSLGHAAGDALLAETARRLEKACSAASPLDEEAWLARIGGDEFVITFKMKDSGDLLRFTRELTATLRRPIQVEQRAFRVSASVGVAIYPDHGSTASQLLKNADAAMYLAKGDGRDTVRVFDQSLADAADYALETEQLLAVALNEDQLRLHFQPIVNANGVELLGVEALIRWQHPERGLVMPDEFIRIAEQGPIIAPISRWVLEEALRHLKSWIALGWRGACVSINLSGQQFRDPAFADAVTDALADAQVDGKRLELEFTERVLMNELDGARSALEKLRAIGVSLAIDDFGTGYSSLSRLRESPIQKLKIDQSFVADLPNSHTALAVVASLLQLGRGLSIEVIAEGVETEAQRECLELLGCRAMQGYLFAQPMDPIAFVAWLDRRLQHR